MRALFAYDGSPFAKRALRYATHLGPDLEAVVVSVAPALIEAPPTEQSTDPEHGIEEARQLAEEARDALAAYGVEPTVVHVVGNPAAEILSAAEQRRADLIVVGQRGQGTIARFIEGSVAERVVRHATCDVLVVR